MEKLPKDQTVKDKIRHIAKFLDELNSKKDVKCGVKNNYGHAKVYQFFRGCSIWVHHMFDNKLLIDLLISSSAMDNYPERSDSALKKFNSYFEITPQIDKNYILPSRPDKPHLMASIDVTADSAENILKMLTKIKNMNA